MAQDTCSEVGCDSPVRCRSLCAHHYDKARYERTIDVTQPKGVFVRCGAAGCERRSESKGFCMKHYTRWKRHGDPLVVLPRPQPQPKPPRPPKARPTRTTKVRLPCSVAECSRLMEARGLCDRHYRRLRLYGDPLGRAAVVRRTVRDPRLRILDGVTVTDEGCWEWPQRDTNGYGRIGYRSKMWWVHRFSYELFVGPIPDGLQLDHLCRKPSVLQSRTPGTGNAERERPARCCDQDTLPTGPPLRRAQHVREANEWVALLPHVSSRARASAQTAVMRTSPAGRDAGSVSGSRPSSSPFAPPVIARLEDATGANS